MPANLTPEYKAAETAFRKAGDPDERLEHLREMLRVIPKHKGTDHLQAEIKRRIKDLSSAIAGASSKGGARTGPATHVPAEGAAQISLLGAPNSGKSTLHNALTGSHSESGPYPFTTQFPQPGMYVFDDVSFQLVDLPALSPQHPIPWIVNALQPADAALFVVDLSDPDCVDLAAAAFGVLEQRSIVLTGTWPAADEPQSEGSGEDLSSFVLTLPTVVVASQRAASSDWSDELEVFIELSGFGLPSIAVSPTLPESLDDIGRWLVTELEIVRVYTKIPGQAPDMHRPFTVRRGETVGDVARLVHREMAEGVRFARVWGNGSFAGRQVGRDHAVEDGDVLELHV